MNFDEIPEWRKQLMIDIGCWKTTQIFYVIEEKEGEQR